MNSAVAECSHVDCPHRGRAWSHDVGAAPSHKQVMTGGRRAPPFDPREALFDKTGG
jgi:hypothetical protein